MCMPKKKRQLFVSSDQRSLEVQNRKNISVVPIKVFDKKYKTLMSETWIVDVFQKKRHGFLRLKRKETFSSHSKADRVLSRPSFVGVTKTQTSKTQTSDPEIPRPTSRIENLDPRKTQTH